jgi:hypothetical protein
MFTNGGEIEVKARPKSPRPAKAAGGDTRPINKDRKPMGGIGKKDKDSKSAKASVRKDDKSGKPSPKANEDDDMEDGDIATPKVDRDDEQQGL